MVPRSSSEGVRQRGLMIAIEFGQPESMSLRAAWAMVNKMDENLFAQAIVLPLLDDHHILTQVAGHAMPIVKILPPLNISESDVDWFLEALEDVMVKLHKFPGPAWEVLKKLGNHGLPQSGVSAARVCIYGIPDSALRKSSNPGSHSEPGSFWIDC